MTIQRAGRGVLIAVLGLIAASCTTNQAPPRHSKGGDGTLRIAMVREPQSLNPNLGTDELAMLVGENIFSKLVELTSDGSIVPDLAERWEESADGLSYTFHLRSGVTWHDGRPFTAQDVVSTFQRVPVESSNVDLRKRIAGVDQKGDLTVVVRLKTPWAAFIPALGWYGTTILPDHVYGTTPWEGHAAQNQPIGTGPFRFRAWERGRRIVLDRNDEYFGPGPYLDSVEYLITPSNEVAVNMLVDGQADLLIGRPPSARVSELSRRPGLRLLMGPGDGRAYLGFNMRRPPFDDLRARRAVNLALDREALVDRALSGIGAPAIGFYTPSVGWAYNANARVPDRDVVAARRLIAAAVPPAYSGVLLCPRGVTRLAEEVVTQLRAVGLHMRVEAVDQPAFISRVLRTREFDVALMSGSQGPDPDNLATRVASDGAMQFMGYRNDDVDQALARGASSSDVVVRARAYHRAQELLAQDLPIAPLTETVRVSLFREGLRGLPQEDARSLVGDYNFSLVRRTPAPE